jgi:hypothetical protein
MPATACVSLLKTSMYLWYPSDLCSLLPWVASPDEQSVQVCDCTAAIKAVYQKSPAWQWTRNGHGVFAAAGSPRISDAGTDAAEVISIEAQDFLDVHGPQPHGAGLCISNSLVPLCIPLRLSISNPAWSLLPFGRTVSQQGYRQLTQLIAGAQAGRGSMDVPSVCKMEAADGLGVLEDAHGRRSKLAWEPINETPRFGNAGGKRRPQTAGHWKSWRTENVVTEGVGSSSVDLSPPADNSWCVPADSFAFCHTSSRFHE